MFISAQHRILMYVIPPRTVAMFTIPSHGEYSGTIPNAGAMWLTSSNAYMDGNTTIFNNTAERHGGKPAYVRPLTKSQGVGWGHRVSPADLLIAQVLSEYSLS